MRAPFQILAIPYQIIEDRPHYCIFHRRDADQWQFVAGGGEDEETPIQAAAREIYEEAGITADTILNLKSMCYLPVQHFSQRYLYHWSKDTYVIPEYAFAFYCKEKIKLSHEHTEYVWLTYEEAYAKLSWDSNRTALYELHCRLTHSKH